MVRSCAPLVKPSFMFSPTHGDLPFMSGCGLHVLLLLCAEECRCSSRKVGKNQEQTDVEKLNTLSYTCHSGSCIVITGKVPVNKRHHWKACWLQLVAITLQVPVAGFMPIYWFSRAVIHVLVLMVENTAFTTRKAVYYTVGTRVSTHWW